MKRCCTYVRVVAEFFRTVVSSVFSSRLLFSVNSVCFVVRLIRLSCASDPRWKKRKEMIVYLAGKGPMRSPSPLSCCCPPSLVVNAVSVVPSSSYIYRIPKTGSQRLCRFMFTESYQAPRFITQPTSTKNVIGEGQTKIIQCQALG